EGGAVVGRGGPGEPPGGGAEAVPTGTLPGATGPGRRLDLRRTGLPVVQPCGGGVAVPGVRRALRAQEPAGDEQLALWGLGAGLPGGADDGGAVGSVDAPLPHLRDEWRKLPLPRVDEREEAQGNEAPRTGPGGGQPWRAGRTSAPRRGAPGRSAPPGPPRLRVWKPRSR